MPTGRSSSCTPDNWLGLGNLGSALMMTGDFAAAVDPLSRSLNLEKDAYFLSNLGIIYYYLGEYDRSVETHREAVTEMPRSVSTWLNLGDALRFSSQPAEAASAYETAKKLSGEEALVSPSAPDNLYRQAWAAAGTGDLDAADELIRRSVGLAPTSPYAHYYDALIQYERGDRVAAIAALRRALQEGYPSVFLAIDPLFGDLHDDRAFRALVGDVEA